MALIYKIFRREEYEALAADGRTTGAPVDLADGFIHFSALGQVAETAAKHFAGEDELLLLAVDADRLGDELKWEISRGGAEFPHLYRELTVSDVEWVRELPLVDGRHKFGDLIP